MHFFAVVCKTTTWNEVLLRLRNAADDGYVLALLFAYLAWASLRNSKAVRVNLFLTGRRQDSPSSLFKHPTVLCRTVPRQNLSINVSQLLADSTLCSFVTKKPKFNFLLYSQRAVPAPLFRISILWVQIEKTEKVKYVNTFLKKACKRGEKFTLICYRGVRV